MLTKKSRMVRCAAVLLALALAGCPSPRGETKSLDEVLSIARARYDSAKGAQMAGDVRTTLDKIIISLNDISQTPAQASAKAGDVAEMLASLSNRSAYTTRPALAEIVTQYRVIGASKESESARVKLLVSRTYHLLAAELETTHFAVS